MEKIVTLAAGSGGGGLLVLLLLVVLITAAACHVHNGILKRKGLANIHEYNSKTSVEEGKESNTYNTITNTNAAYKQTDTANSTELEVLYDTISLVEDTTELQQSTENQDSKLNMEQNVAYESSTYTQISLRSSHVAYHNIMQNSGKRLQEIDHTVDDQYDYV